MKKVASKEPTDGVRCPTGAAYHPASTNFRLKSAATFANNLGWTEVVGCGAVRRWELRSPITTEPVGQHMKNRFFVGVGYKKITVPLEQSWGSEEGKYTVE